jgi:hypothetical protein
LRIRGESVRSIFKRFSCALAEVHESCKAIEDLVFDRKHARALTKTN